VADDDEKQRALARSFQLKIMDHTYSERILISLWMWTVPIAKWAFGPPKSSNHNPDGSRERALNSLDAAFLTIHFST